MSENLPTIVESPRVELGVVSASGPKELVARATEAANALAEVIKSRGLASRIQGKDFVRCEGWTTLAAMMGATPHEVSVDEHQDGIFIATVELRRLSDGQSIGRASAECGADDEVDRNGKAIWANRPRYARRSMALTRATAKACRLTFSWIMVLSGYEATPAEEVPEGGFRDTPRKAKLEPRPAHVTEDGEVHGYVLNGEALALATDKRLSQLAVWAAAKPIERASAGTAITEEQERRRSKAADAMPAPVGAPMGITT